MSSEEKELARLPQLIAELQEGSIVQDNMQVLNHLLRSSEKARDTFLLHAHVDAGLHWKFSAKQKVLDLYAPDSYGESLAKVSSPQTQLVGYVNDEGFEQFAELVSPQKAHAQLWQQAYPRLRAYVFLCIPTLRESQIIVDRITDSLLEDYQTDCSFLKWVFDTTRRDVHEYLSSEGDEITLKLTAQFADACLSVSESPSDLDVAAFNESLEESVPHLFSAGTLRLLYLRYLHGLNLKQIANHLNLPIQKVYSRLANVRLMLCSNEFASSEGSMPEGDCEQLLLVSMFLDGRRFTKRSAKRISQWLSASNRNRQKLTKMAIVHEYMDRQLSVCRLLYELETCKDQSIIQAVEASIREIEQFARVSTPIAKMDLSTEVKPAWLQNVFPVGLAAGLLLALAIGLWKAGTPEKIGPNGGDARAIASVLESNPETRNETPLPPVVAVVSESFGFPGGATNQLSVGTPLRMQQAVRFEQGIVQVTTVSGSTLVFEGPTDATMVDRNHVFLQHGKMSGLNNVPGRSLVVESPYSRVVDIGTEFGVSVNDTFETEVAVYEGEVEIGPLTATSTQKMALSSRRLEAGFEAKVDSSGSVPAEFKPLSHEREFVRSDEVELRKEAETGSSNAEARIAFYEMLRIDGLLAYQGFHEESAGEEFSFGFDSPEVRLVGDASFGPDILFSSRLGPSGSIVTSTKFSCYMDIDTSERSQLAKSGLVDAKGLIGNSPGELWLGWRTQAVAAKKDESVWAGLSLMYGDKRESEEMLFIGLPQDILNYGVHIYELAGKLKWQKLSLDFDPTTAGVQPLASDFREHFWVLRLRMNGTTTEASVWCDVAASEAESTPPQAKFEMEDFRFDRIRFDAGPDDATGAWQLDDLVIALTSDAIAEVSEFLGHAPPVR